MSRKPRLPFPADDLQAPTALQDHYGNLVLTNVSAREQALRQFVNAWGWKRDRLAMLADLQKLMQELQEPLDDAPPP